MCKKLSSLPPPHTHALSNIQKHIRMLGGNEEMVNVCRKLQNWVAGTDVAWEAVRRAET